MTAAPPRRALPLPGAVRRLLGLGAEAAGPLPPRLEAMVREQQASAEVLIGLMQFAAIGTFAALYAAARAANPPPMMIEPVPVALALYAGFTGLRFWLALRRRLTPVLLTLSVLVDMGVLIALIWAFHLQYMAPASISLKAPTLMYVFILIALRALRFEAFYVLLAGTAAAAGWAVLLGCALLADPPARITRSFLDYVTSPAILLGAEFDKIVSIAMVTAVLALVVLRGRRLLLDAGREQLAANDLSRFFAPEVALEIRRIGGVMAGMAERRQAAILMTDLRGFTRLSRELAPRDLLALLGDYQRRVVGAIRAHGGSIDKYLGDGVLASFGAVRPNATYAADALRAAEAIGAAIADWNLDRAAKRLPAVEVGLAVAVGEVLFGAVGDAERLEYTVIGDPVNLAAKLEKHNKAEASHAIAEVAAWRLALAQGFAPRAPVEHRTAREVPGAGVLDLVVLRQG